MPCWRSEGSLGVALQELEGEFLWWVNAVIEAVRVLGKKKCVGDYGVKGDTGA